MFEISYSHEVIRHFPFLSILRLISWHQFTNLKTAAKKRKEEGSLSVYSNITRNLTIPFPDTRPRDTTPLQQLVASSTLEQLRTKGG